LSNYLIKLSAGSWRSGLNRVLRGLSSTNTGADLYGDVVPAVSIKFTGG